MAAGRISTHPIPIHEEAGPQRPHFFRPLPTPAFELDRPNAVWLHVRGGSYFNKVRHDPYPRAEGSSPAPPPNSLGPPACAHTVCV